jgi:predicted nucleotidyltransferase
MRSEILKSNFKHIEILCERHGVVRLDVFGSILRDDFCTESDIDFLVLFKRDEQTNAFNQYFDLKEALEALLHRNVDLVCANAIRNPYFKREVEQPRQPLYAA